MISPIMLQMTSHPLFIFVSLFLGLCLVASLWFAHKFRRGHEAALKPAVVWNLIGLAAGVAGLAFLNRELLTSVTLLLIQNAYLSLSARK